uniref:Serine protease 55 n=1 Tax=Rousettus aegyptiacus TaxID=9407 RepID=A0A7J8BTL2_ROUAE|nr:serine protease 55 [Rousettus aegyptiacus]
MNVGIQISSRSRFHFFYISTQKQDCCIIRVWQQGQRRERAESKGNIEQRRGSSQCWDQCQVTRCALGPSPI